MIAPSVTYELESHLNPAECRARLAAIVFVVKPFTVFEMKPPRGHSLLFQGSLQNGQFSLQALPEATNNRGKRCVPIVRGRIIPHDDASTVQVTIAVNFVDLLFFIGWIAAMWFMSLSPWTNNAGQQHPLTFPIVMSIAGCFAMCIFYLQDYVPNAKRCLRIFTELFETKQTGNDG